MPECQPVSLNELNCIYRDFLEKVLGSPIVSTLSLNVSRLSAFDGGNKTSSLDVKSTCSSADIRRQAIWIITCR